MMKPSLWAAAAAMLLIACGSSEDSSGASGSGGSAGSSTGGSAGSGAAGAAGGSATGGNAGSSSGGSAGSSSGGSAGSTGGAAGAGTGGTAGASAAGAGGQGTCPTSEPSQNDPCTDAGLVCCYADAPANPWRCVPSSPDGGTGYQWVTLNARECCPASAPSEGDACNAPGDLQCCYPSGGFYCNRQPNPDAWATTTCN